MKPAVKILAMIAGATAVFCLGLAFGKWPTREAGTSAEVPVTAMPPERKILYWYDPMMPQQHFDRPGKSPFMDMELVPKYTDEEVSGLRIDPMMLHNNGIRLARVVSVPTSRRIRVSGLFEFDEHAIAVVQARSGGFVEKVWPLAEGDTVKAGQPLAELLIPVWAAGQQEFLAVRDTGDPTLLEGARQRLRLQGMPAEMISELERSGTVQNRSIVRTPISGVVRALNVRQGMTLATGETLATINGLETIWLNAAVPEAQADALSVGGRAETSPAAYPGRILHGRVAMVVPILNAASRSLRVRIVMNNSAGMLRPGMSAQVELEGGGAGQSLAVPTEALIRTGKRTLVMQAVGNGGFMPTEVVVGHETGNMTLILSGLEEGGQVVSSGQFLLDSEASLSGLEAHSGANATTETGEGGQ